MQESGVARVSRLHRISRAVQQEGKHLSAYIIVIDNQDLNWHLSRFLHKDYQSMDFLYHSFAR